MAFGERNPEQIRAWNERTRKPLARSAMKRTAGPVKRRRHVPTGFTLAAKGEHTCRNCRGRAQHAHHAVPRSLAPAARADLRNCLPLCADCHSRWHHGTPIPRSVFTETEWAYISSLIGSSWLDKRYPVSPRTHK